MIGLKLFCCLCFPPLGHFAVKRPNWGNFYSLVFCLYCLFFFWPPWLTSPTHLLIALSLWILIYLITLIHLSAHMRTSFKKCIIAVRPHSPWSLGFLTLFLLGFNYGRYELVRVASASMNPTLRSHDLIICSKRFETELGAIYTFHSPQNHKLLLIKRMLAGPGDRIQIDDKQINVNDRPLILAGTQRSLEQERDDPLDKKLLSRHAKINRISFRIFQTERVNTAPLKLSALAQGRFFMMGDNWPYSQDSRHWGLVPREKLKSRALFVLYRPTSGQWGLPL